MTRFLKEVAAFTFLAGALPMSTGYASLKLTGLFGWDDPLTVASCSAAIAYGVIIGLVAAARKEVS
jgi:hypothetical protein